MERDQGEDRVSHRRSPYFGEIRRPPPARSQLRISPSPASRSRPSPAPRRSAPSLQLRRLHSWRSPVGRASPAIASLNSVLSEHTFKCLGLSAGNDDEVEDGYGSDQEGPAVVEGDKDELAISRLGLPTQLIATLKKRGITLLFPIHVS
ncbi:hypothetical protein ZWY2020_057461 [Hordeum vulgare]|nr:hypothetical protein ZWY2020_057461 [Hordeum vulgare]